MLLGLRHGVTRSLVGAVLLIGCCGCGRSESHLIPTETTARQVLETTLNAWQNHQPPGKISTGPPSIEVVDAKWRDGDKLQSYEIIGSEPSEGPPRFSVRLTVVPSGGEVAQQETVQYVVLGKEPIWVYRAEDLDAATGM
jgi:hypothetical protein